MQLPFPIQAHTKQQLERMGIPLQAFQNLPLAAQAEIASQLRQQLEAELGQRNTAAMLTIPENGAGQQKPVNIMQNSRSG